jgi:hypothetical protein
MRTEPDKELRSWKHRTWEYRRAMNRYHAVLAHGTQAKVIDHLRAELSRVLDLLRRTMPYVQKKLRQDIQEEFKR